MTTVGEPLVAPLPAATAVGVVRPALRLRELALVVAGGVALAIGLTWPVAAHLGTNIAGDLGDPVRTAWQVAWEGHALTLSSGTLFDTNAFWPLSAPTCSRASWGPAGRPRSSPAWRSATRRSGRR